MRKPPESLDAWAAYQRGLRHLGKGTADDGALAERFFQQAIDLDPNFGGGYCGLALAYLQAARGFASRNLGEAQQVAEGLARRAVALDDADADAHSCLAEALWTRGDHIGAQAEAERALAMTPNLAGAHGVLGAVLIFSGRPMEGIASIETFLRVDPRAPFSTGRLNLKAAGLYFARDYEAAVEAANRVIRSNPSFPMPYRWLAAALGQLGRIEEAKETLAKALAIAPASFNQYARGQAPWFRPEDHAHMVEGLRKAGWAG